MDCFWALGLRYSIVRVPADHPDLAGNWAVCDFATQRVLIDETLPEQMARKKLLHEIGHALNELAGEQYARFLEDRLFPFLTDSRNAPLISRIIHNTKETT